MTRWEDRVSDELANLRRRCVRMRESAASDNSLASRVSPGANKRRLAIIGSYPPPYGGVTTHIMRLCALLDEACLDYVLYNAGSTSEKGERVISVYRFRHFWMPWYTFFGKEPCVYIISLRIMSWLAGALMAGLRGKTVAIQLQNTRMINHIHKGGFRKALIRFALRRVSAIVCVNKELVAAMHSIGVDPRRIHLFPGFLPLSSSERDAGQVAPEVWEFCRTKSPLIAANGKVAVWKGEDLYGLDHIVCLIERLKPQFSNVGIVVCFWDHLPKDQPRLRQLMAMAKAKGVAQNIFFNTQRGLFVPVIEKADLLVRPTNTDGDANSIREALYLNVPVVASDVVERPHGTITFKTRDINDFTMKVREVLDTNKEEWARDKPDEKENANERARAYLTLLSRLTQTIQTYNSRGEHQTGSPTS